MPGFQKVVQLSYKNAAGNDRENFEDNQGSTRSSDEPYLDRPLSPRSFLKCKSLMQLNGCGEDEARVALDLIKGIYGSGEIDELDDAIGPAPSMLSDDETTESIERDQHFQNGEFHTSNSFPVSGSDQPEAGLNIAAPDCEFPTPARKGRYSDLLEENQGNRQHAKDKNVSVNLRLNLDPPLELVASPDTASHNNSSVERDYNIKMPLQKYQHQLSHKQQKPRETQTYTERLSLSDPSSSSLGTGTVIAGIGFTALTIGLAVGFGLRRFL